MNNFLELNIKNNLVDALKKQGIVEPTPVQSEAIPKIRENLDVVLESATGSGKTLAYLLPLIEKVDYDKRENQVIILVPTHELALQVNEVLDKVGELSSDPIKTMVIMGDVNIKRQVEKLREKPQFVIGSPGRILELIKLKKISAHTVKTIVIDECDKLLDKNNIEVVKNVIKTTLRDRQIVLASATIGEEVKAIANEMMKSPEFITCTSEVKVNPNITHQYIVCDRRDKILVLRKLMAAVKPKKAIAFINKSEEIEILTSKLQFHGLKADGIHGSYVKNDRRKTMNDFKTEKINLLVSSDLSARGLDISGVTHIFNIDLPEDVNTYVHRSGRTARGAKKGTVISIVSPVEIARLKSFTNNLDVKLDEKTLTYGNVVDVKSVIKNDKKPVHKPSKDKKSTGNAHKKKNSSKSKIKAKANEFKSKNNGTSSSTKNKGKKLVKK